MSNPNFNPQYSTNDIYRDLNASQCLTDDLDAIEQDIENLQSGKASANHTHTPAAIGAAASTHTHADKADLVNGKVPAAQLPSFVDDVEEATSVSNFPATGEEGKIYVDTTENKSYRWSGTQYVEIAGGVAIGETSATAHRGDHGKVAYDHSQNANVHVTEAQKTEWNGKAAGDHTHTAAALIAMASSLFFTNENGGVEYYYGNGSGKNLLTEMAAWPQGFHTAYSIGSTEGNPKDTESWRIFCHKTSGTIGWALAFGTSGSIYANYYDSGWKGWKCLYDALRAPLWTGDYYMTDSQTVTPSKALSECAHGWLLLWSDYNPGEGLANTDFATTMIPNRAYTGQKWGGGQFLCQIPRYADASGEASIIKTLAVHDTKLVGSSFNNVSPRNDVVLRAVYEF